MSHRLLCLIGVHRWTETPPHPECDADHFGATRTCARCGRRERLVADEGGWAGGLWVRDGVSGGERPDRR